MRPNKSLSLSHSLYLLIFIQIKVLLASVRLVYCCVSEMKIDSYGYGGCGVVISMASGGVIQCVG